MACPRTNPLNRYTVTTPSGKLVIVAASAEQAKRQAEAALRERVEVSRANPNDLPPRDLSTMADAIAISSPSGRASKRSQKAAQDRLGKALFGDYDPHKRIAETAEQKYVRLMHSATELRRLAALGMKPRAYVKAAEKLEAEAREAKSNPVFLPKSLFDSYTVKSQGNSGDTITADRIQTLSGAERKAKELGRKYPCVGFDIISARHGSVIKSYAPTTGKAVAKVEVDNTKRYLSEQKKEAKSEVRFRLYVNGQEYADYETEAEARKVGKKEAGAGGKWRVKEVQGNPDREAVQKEIGPYSDPSAANDRALKLRREGAVNIREVKRRDGWWITYIVYELRNPLTGSPSRDIPLLRREHYPQRQAVAISLSEQRRRGNPAGDVAFAVEMLRRQRTHDEPRLIDLAGAKARLARSYPSSRISARDWRRAVNGLKADDKWYDKVMKGADHRDRRNPSGSDDSAAAQLYSDFHGEPSDGETVYEETIELPDAYGELGDLVELKVATLHGKDVTITAPDSKRFDAHKIVKLGGVVSDDGDQLYFVGGDQEIDVEKLGFKGAEVKPHMVIGVLYELTYLTRKGFDKFRPTNYYHHLGEDTGNQPMLVYDPVNKLMSVAGGEYRIKAEGIVN